MDKIIKLPNIGVKLTERLSEAGFQSLSDLKSMGAEGVFLKLKTVFPDACVSTLFAIEGAILGIRWHDIPEQRKRELKNFFNQTCKK